MSTHVAEVDTSSLKPLKLTASNVKTFERHFIDQHGRILHLRGANVGAASKVPNRPSGPLHEHAKVSYIGRPFPLEDAAEHWQRLKSWGLTFLRITVTWDAIEHAGHGQYDEEYLAYLRALLKSMSEYGIVAYVAMHQDVWSRYCGGSGAPGWTLEAAGFDLSSDGEKLVKSGAAFLDGIRGGKLEGERGLWPTGYQKLACASMSTFFWGGKMFAPSLTVQDGEREVNIQSYLQDAFLKAFERLIDAVGDVNGVLGFELMNEPHPGFIGLPTINEWNYNTDLHLGDYPSAFQSMSMGAGHPTPNVPHYTRSFPWPTRIAKRITANPSGTSAWKGSCPWEKEGVWRWSDAKQTAVVLQENYFVKGVKGRDVDFYQDCYWPFVRKWEAMMNNKLRDKKGKMRMIEVVPNEFCPEWPEGVIPQNLVFAPHWYDINTLFKKQFGNFTVNVQDLSRGAFVFKCLYWGRQVKANYARQVKNIVENARKQIGEVPIVIGESGLPMDMNDGTAFKSGDWRWQERMMDAMISAFETSMVGFNLWTYNPSNRDDLGDDWNAENFSWYSDESRRVAVGSQKAGSKSRLDHGARLLDSVVRPYAIATAGTPLSHEYDPSTSVFTYRLQSPIRLGSNSSEEAASAEVPSTAHITEIYLPSRIYAEGKTEYQVSIGGRIKFDYENQRAYLWFSDAPAWADRKKANKIRRVDIWVKGKRPAQDEYGVGSWVTMITLLLLAIVGMIYGTKLQWKQDEIRGIRETKWGF